MALRRFSTVLLIPVVLAALAALGCPTIDNDKDDPTPTPEPATITTTTVVPGQDNILALTGSGCNYAWVIPNAVPQRSITKIVVIGDGSAPTEVRVTATDVPGHPENGNSSLKSVQSSSAADRDWETSVYHHFDGYYDHSGDWSVELIGDCSATNVRVIITIA